jgi:predicted RND superfamily exporter protein
MLRFGKKVAKYRVWILVLSVLLLIPSAFGFLSTRVNYDILCYLPDDIETMEGQQILLDDFGKGAYALFVADGLTDSQAAQVKAEIEQIDHVAEVLWYDSVADISVPQEMLPDKLYDAFHSGDATMMAIFLDTGTSADETMDAITEMRQVAGQQCFISSMSAIVTDTRDLVQQELFWYVLIAVVLCCVVLAITMDSWLAPALFMANIGVAVIYNLGTNVIQGEISFVTMALAAVLQLAVTMDYSIFLWNSYREQRELYDDREEAMARAISMTIGSVAGSSLTTIAGFVALCFMSFTLGMDLGIVMAKGVVLGVLCTVTVLPALILVCDKAIQKTTHRAFNLNGEKISNFVVRHNKVFLVVILLLWIPSIFGYNRVQVYYNLDSSLPDYLPSVQANQELNETFDMSTIHIILADENLEAKDVKNMLSEIEQVDGVSFALSEDSLIGSRIPKDFLPASATEELASGGRQLMIIGSKYKVASDEANAQVDQLNEILKRYDPSGLLIGEAPCTKDLITITDHDFTVVSAVSIVLIFLIILLVLRSVSLPVILVLVIELAIYINMSISYYTGTVLPFIASIVIGTIQLGATVDYAILMTNRYEHERMSGKDKVEATKAALASSIPSIVTSALGFFAATIGVGVYSDVDLIGSLCLLMARGALISMAIVILLLPSLYLLCDKLILKTSWGLRAKKHKRTEQAIG